VHFPAGAKVWARPTYTFNCDAINISSDWLSRIVEQSLYWQQGLQSQMSQMAYTHHSLWYKLSW
jgi:hypothetical protein